MSERRSNWKAFAYAVIAAGAMLWHSPAAALFASLMCILCAIEGDDR